MPGVIVLSPAPVFADPNQQSVHSNSTINSNSALVFSGFGAKELTLIVNVKNAPTGTTPTLQFTLQEMDPGDLVTTFGPTRQTSVINAVGVYTATIHFSVGSAVRVSWAVGGSSPSFTGVYTTLLCKNASTAILQNSSAAEIGTASAPLRTDPTGTTTQPISAATLPLPTGAAADATLTNGTQKAIVRGGAKGATAAADVTSTTGGTDHQALDVQLYHSGGAIDPRTIRTLTSTDVVTTVGAAANAAAVSGNPVLIAGYDGTNVRTMLVDATGKQVGVSNPGDKLSTANSTTANLGSGAVYLGTYEDTLGYSELTVGIFASHASAALGFSIEWSADAVTVHDTDAYAIAAANGKQYSFGPKFRYYRIRYTNGGTLTTTLVIQSILRASSMRSSSHRIEDSLIADDDVEVMKSVLSGKAPNGSYVNILATNGGNLKASIQEWGDSAVISGGVNGSLAAGGPVAAGTAIGSAGNPIMVAGSDGANLRALLVDTLGKLFSRPGDVVSTANSTTANLGISATYTGTFEDSLGFADITLGIFVDQASAASGLNIEYSNDGTNVRDSDTYSVAASNGQQLSFAPKFRYFRIRYVNGTVATTTLVIQTILRATHVRQTTHRLGDALNDEQDSDLTKAAIAARTPAGSFINLVTTANGSLCTTPAELGTFNNGAETAVAGTAIQIAASNSARRSIIIQNTGSANIRVGVTGVTATTGMRLVPNAVLILEHPYIPTQAIFAIREGAISSTALTQELT